MTNGLNQNFGIAGIAVLDADNGSYVGAFTDAQGFSFNENKTHIMGKNSLGQPVTSASAGDEPECTITGVGDIDPVLRATLLGETLETSGALSTKTITFNVLSDDSNGSLATALTGSTSAFDSISSGVYIYSSGSIKSLFETGVNAHILVGTGSDEILSGFTTAGTAIIYVNDPAVTNSRFPLSGNGQRKLISLIALNDGRRVGLGSLMGIRVYRCYVENIPFSLTAGEMNSVDLTISVLRDNKKGGYAEIIAGGGITSNG